MKKSNYHYDGSRVDSMNFSFPLTFTMDGQAITVQVGQTSDGQGGNIWYIGHKNMQMDDRGNYSFVPDNLNRTIHVAQVYDAQTHFSTSNNLWPGADTAKLTKLEVTPDPIRPDVTYFGEQITASFTRNAFMANGASSAKYAAYLTYSDGHTEICNDNIQGNTVTCVYSTYAEIASHSAIPSYITIKATSLNDPASSASTPTLRLQGKQWPATVGSTGMGVSPITTDSKGKLHVDGFFYKDGPFVGKKDSGGNDLCQFNAIAHYFNTETNKLETMQCDKAAAAHSMWRSGCLLPADTTKSGSVSVEFRLSCNVALQSPEVIASKILPTK